MSGADRNSPARTYRVAWLTLASCPLQHNLLSTAARTPFLDLEVIFCARHIEGREWWGWHNLGSDYKHLLLSGVVWRGICLNPGIVSLCIKKKYDLFIVTSYAHPTMQLAMATLTILRRRWAIFGERPGVNSSSQIRNLLRRAALFLPSRHASCAFGTGTLATSAFSKLFRGARPTASIPYLVDLREFLKMPLPEIDRGNINFLYCGQLIGRKGFDVLCEAAATLLASEPSARLTIVGDGSQRELIAPLQARFNDRIRWIGSIPFERRSEGYRDATVFVLPSRYDGWGVALHEAMARGLPAIGTADAGSAYDLIEPGVNGFIVKSGDAGELFRSMQFFVTNPAQVVPFGSKARETASRYNAEWGVANLLAVLDSVVAESR
jgi:glycosyltransferase involved in cell wall biosynthesis